MPINIPNNSAFVVRHQEAFVDLDDQVAAEGKRLVVTGNGRELKILPQRSKLGEFFAHLFGIPAKEIQNLRKYLASLPSAESIEKAVESHKVGESFRKEIGDAYSQHQVGNEAPSKVNKSQYQYVEHQQGQLCLKHAIAAFCNRPVFQGREDFLTYRNTIYQTMGDFIPQESFGREDSDVEAVSNVLNAMQADPLYREGFDKHDQNWVIHEISIERVGKAVDEPNDEKQLNDALERFAAQSEGKRFIIRTGSRYGSGHYSLLSKNANGSWTFTNSVGSSIKHGSSPARLIEYQRARNMPLYLWTQTDKTPDEFARAIPRQVLN